MPFAAALVKWIMENPRALRFGLIALAAVAITGWVYHEGASHAARVDSSRQIITAVHVKEQYDEISNSRPDDHGLLDLLRAGRF